MSQIPPAFEHLFARTQSTRVLAEGAGGAVAFRLDYKEKLFARNYRIPVLSAAAGTLGGKAEIAFRLRRFDRLGADLVAATLNALIATGAEPLFFVHQLALPEPDLEITRQVIQGVSDACLECRCALFPGAGEEHAGGFHLSGFAVGAAEKSRILDPRNVEAGDSVIGLASNGLHTAGYEIVSRIIGDSAIDLNAVMSRIQGALADELLRPSPLYAGTVRGLFGTYKVKRTIKAMAHIDRGGISLGLAGMLPAGLSMRIKRVAWPVPPIFEWLQERARLDSDAMSGTFNMGIGFAMIVRPAFTRAILGHLRRLGEKPYFLGKVKKSADEEGEARIQWY